MNDLKLPRVRVVVPALVVAAAVGWAMPAAAASIAERLDETAMELMRDPERSAEMRKPLDAKEVEKLEAKLKEKPDQVEARLRLLAHYRQDRTPEGKAAFLGHTLWVVENAPESS